MLTQSDVLILLFLLLFVFFSLSLSSLSLLGMVQHHVTTVAAIFVCNLLLCSAHSAPNAALLKVCTKRKPTPTGDKI